MTEPNEAGVPLAVEVPKESANTASGVIYLAEIDGPAPGRRASLLTLAWVGVGRQGKAYRVAGLAPAEDVDMGL